MILLRHFHTCIHTTLWLKCLCARSYHLHAIRDDTWAFVFVPLQSLFTFVSSFLVSIHFIHTNLFDNVAGSEHHRTESTKWGLRLFGHNPASHRLWAQRDRQIRRIRGYGFDLPGTRVSLPPMTLATTARSPRMLRLTTSTSGMRWLHHCTSRSEKQMRTCHKLIALMKKACYQVHGQF